MTLQWRELADGLFVATIPGTNPEAQYEVGRYHYNQTVSKLVEKWFLLRRDGVPGGPLTFIASNYVSAANAKKRAETIG